MEFRPISKDSSEFFKFPIWLAKMQGLSIEAKLVYARLRRYAGDNNFAYPKQQTIAEELSLSPRMVKDYVAELKKFGLVETQKITMTKTAYFLMEPLVEKELVTADMLPSDDDEDEIMEKARKYAIADNESTLSRTTTVRPDVPPYEESQLRESVKEKHTVSENEVSEGKKLKNTKKPSTTVFYDGKDYVEGGSQFGKLPGESGKLLELFLAKSWELHKINVRISGNDFSRYLSNCKSLIDLVGGFGESVQYLAYFMSGAHNLVKRGNFSINHFVSHDMARMVLADMTKKPKPSNDRNKHMKKGVNYTDEDRINKPINSKKV